MTLLQKESEYRKAVESALHSSLAELDHFRKSNLEVQACSIHNRSWGQHESGTTDIFRVSNKKMESMDGIRAAEQTSMGEPNSRSMDVQHKSCWHQRRSRTCSSRMLQNATVMDRKCSCTLHHRKLQMPPNTSTSFSIAERSTRHKHPLFLYTTQDAATSNQQQREVRHQNISLAKSNEVLQKGAMDHKGIVANQLSHNQVLSQQVSVNVCNHVHGGVNAATYIRHSVTRDRVLNVAFPADATYCK